MSHQLPEELSDPATAFTKAQELHMLAAAEFAKMPYSEQRLCAGRSYHPNEIRDMLLPKDPTRISNPPAVTEAQSAWFDNLLGHMFSK